jgi:peptide/nickel transport system permease protein
MRTFGIFVLAAAVLAAIGAPVLSPHSVDESFRTLLNAPPTVPRVRDVEGRWHLPFIYGWERVNQLEQIYEPDHSELIPLVWFRDWKLVQSSDAGRAPLMLLGADSYGRDVFTRLLFGARVSLGLAAVAATGALILGVVIGGVAGYAGGPTDDLLMRATDFVLVLPTIYVALALRAALPLVLSPRVIFLVLSVIFAIVGSPFFARGVRAVVRSERQLDYAVAAVSLGAGHARLLVRHLLPAALGFIAVQTTMLVPAFIIAEATLSFVGLGFPDPTPSWGTMLHDASSIRVFADFPWLLSPAMAMFLVVLALNLVLERLEVWRAQIQST